MSTPNNSQIYLKGRGFRHWRISVKLLVVMLLLALVPLVVVTLTSMRTGGDLLEDEAIINLERLSYSTAQRIEQLLADNNQFINLVARNRDVVDGGGCPWTDLQRQRYDVDREIKSVGRCGSHHAIGGLIP